MLPAIIFIHDVYMSLLEQDHQEGAGVREPYKMYEMYEIYKVGSILGQYGFPKESEAGHLLAGDLPPWYDSRSTWEPALAVRPLEAEQRLYPD